MCYYSHNICQVQRIVRVMLISDGIIQTGYPKKCYKVGCFGTKQDLNCSLGIHSHNVII